MAPRTTRSTAQKQAPAAKHQVKKTVRITRAKTLDKAGFDRAIEAIRAEDHALRNEVLLRLSFFCGLRAQEIAGLQWNRHLLDAHGKVVKVLSITSDIAKGSNRVVERDIPVPDLLRDKLIALRAERPNDRFVIYALAEPRNFTNGYENRTEDGGVAPNTLVKYFGRLYDKHGFLGLTSHSGRRTFISYGIRQAPLLGGSIRDIQILAGHRSLDTTAGYIEPSTQQRRIVNGVFG